jgi:hypothetical protein
METAKVDIQKLQLLNDRIAQCFDALNQVRFSVHGLSHTSGSQAYGQQGLGQQPFGPQGIGSPLGAQGLPSPSAFGQNPLSFGQNPLVNPFLTQSFQNPYAGLSHSSYGSQVPIGMTSPIGLGAIPSMGTYGLGAYGNVPLWADPYLAARVTQTFPFVQLPIVPPVGI